MATLFTGRTFEINVYPFSFAEYVKYQEPNDQYSALDRYIEDGGMSGSYLYHDREARYDYIANVFDTLIVRDIRKKYLASNDKYYLSDHAFRYAKPGTKNLDYGRILENIVAIEKEIDFVAIKRDEKIYIQVSDNIIDEKTFAREVAPLLKIN